MGPDLPWTPWSIFSEDVLDQDDTISISEITDNDQTSFERAGFAERTRVDTFLNMNGDTFFVTDI